MLYLIILGVSVSMFVCMHVYKFCRYFSIHFHLILVKGLKFCGYLVALDHIWISLPVKFCTNG